MRDRGWKDRVGWQLSAAVLLSMVSGFGFSENPWLKWLRWLGIVGEFITRWLATLSIPFVLAFLLGFAVNIAFWTFVLVVTAQLLSLNRRKSAAA